MKLFLCTGSQCELHLSLCIMVSSWKKKGSHRCPSQCDLNVGRVVAEDMESGFKPGLFFLDV